MRIPAASPTASVGANHVPTGITVTPPRTPGATRLCPTPTFSRTWRSGRTTIDAVAPSGTPTSVIIPNRGSVSALADAA